MTFRSISLVLAVLLGPALLSLPASAATLLGLTTTGELYDSADDGVTWSIRSALPVSNAVGIAAHSSIDDLFLASASGVVHRTTDGGTTWNAVGAVSAGDVTDLLIRGSGELQLLTESGVVYSSVDEGASFSVLAAITAANLVSLTEERASDDLYALTATGEVYESVDGGVTWTAKGALTFSNAEQIRALGAVLYVLTGTGETARSVDAGASWTVVGTLSQVGMRALVANGTNLVAATQEGEVAISADGTSWTWQGAINQLVVTALGVDAPSVDAVGAPSAGFGLALATPWPNPRVEGAARIAFDLPREAEVRFTLHDARGRRVAERVPEVFPAGRGHAVAWDPGGLAAGVYQLRLATSRGERVTRRWVILR